MCFYLPLRKRFISVYRHRNSKNSPISGKERVHLTAAFRERGRTRRARRGCSSAIGARCSLKSGLLSIFVIICISQQMGLSFAQPNSRSSPAIVYLTRSPLDGSLLCRCDAVFSRKR
ncbi:hypothetical protein EVAR_55288_1 [Eumeta japonica]|uniref:Uncharacterized protein n=1 Tax=Eumeta variegata TaxID=151549 RepID=A0A4C1ZEY5_EUMVA|nr:hypothetical protein EVAR_55288_1 [Eumeta japonica]